MESELFKQNPWWEGKFEEKSFKRQTYTDRILADMASKEILFLTGLRRVGKTTIMRQMISILLENKADPKDIMFLSLDAFNLLDYTIHQLVEKYREIHKRPASDFFYLFLDEITAKDNFEQELKGFYDTDNIKIICSSSIATFMHDRKSYLTGRTKTIEIMPLTFKEFLQFKQAHPKKIDKAKLDGHFKDYLKLGGIPQYVLTEDQNYMEELVQSIIYKDIVAYHRIENEKVVKELFILLCQRVGKPVSYNKLANILQISLDSVKRYIGYFEKAFLFYTVDRHSRSYNERITSPKKVYVGDVGIKNIITGFKDLGASYENLVFLKIKGRDPSYYLADGVEIDFFMKDLVVEAKYNQDLEGKQKEAFRGLKVKEKIVAKGVDFFMPPQSCDSSPTRHTR